MANEYFAIEERAVRNLSPWLLKIWKKRSIKQQEKASGITPTELSELEQELDEILSRM